MPGDAATTIYTIGHSTRSAEQFLALLQREGIRRLVDIRAFPLSRKFPHFNGEALAAQLSRAGIQYEHAPELGGRRRPRPDSRNVAWRNEQFRGYADHMETAAFGDALRQLIHEGAERPTVIMCSEAVPWRCHRTLVADALLARGVDVAHILDSVTRPHTLTSFGTIADGSVRYENADGQKDLFV